MEAKRGLVLLGDVFVFTALTAGVFPLLSQFIPQALAMLGFGPSKNPLGGAKMCSPVGEWSKGHSDKHA